MSKELVFKLVGGFLVIFMAQVAAILLTTGKSNNVGRFNLTSDRISKDLDGRAVSLMLNQVWPFDLSQNLDVQIIAKKQVDDFVAIVVEIKALAPVQADTTVKEQFSTSTTSKDVPKTQPKMPTKLRLVGRMKLTYEIVDNEWYLLGVENLNLRAIPLD